MPEYRALRAKYSFIEMCHKPELCTEITLMPIHEFGFDAAILFSDILVIPEALGVGLRFEEGKGPIIEKPLVHINDISQLKMPKIEESLSYVSSAIRLIKPQLKVPLLGFCGAPFTVASYMIEGGSSRDLKKTKQWMLRNSNSFHDLLNKISCCTIDYLKMQIKAGVDAIQIFDSWAHFLGHNHFREFSLHYLQKLMEGIKETQIPVILYCRGSSVFANQLAELQPAGISIDWNGNLAEIRSKVPSGIALQGNMDPDVLYADSKVICKEAGSLINSMRNDPGYIFNLGHGIHPDTPVESVRTLVDFIKSQV